MAKRVKKTTTINNAKKKLQRTQEVLVLLNNEDRKIVERFINTFVLCEITCKHFLSSYNKINKENKGNNLYIKNIRSALNFYEVNLPDRIITFIFSSANTRGKKSAKKLRDGIVHSINKGDIEEVISRQSELLNLMDEFLTYFS